MKWFRNFLNFLTEIISKKYFPQSSIFEKEIRRQLFASLIVNIITFSHGIALGWAAPTLKQLSSNTTPLNFQISLVQASWIASLVGLGSVFGNLILCNLINIIGRKPCLLLMAVPNICLWILIYAANSVEYLYAARFIGGITGGSSIAIIPLYINEIANSKNRGAIQAFFTIAFNSGILIGYVLASKVDYFVLPRLVIFLPILFLILFSFFPETPHFLISKGHDEKAIKSIQFYRNYSVVTQICEEEFRNLKSIVINSKDENRLEFRNFFTKTAFKSYGIVLILLILNQFCGVYSFVTYMSDIFTLSGSPFDPNTCTIIIGITQLFGNLTTVLFIDRCGRKILIVISSIGVILGLTAFGFYTYLIESLQLSSYSWIPLVLMMLIIFIGNIGIVSVTVISVVEILPIKIRSIGFSCSLILLSFLVFIMLKIFPIFMHAFGISISMWFCAAITFICLIFIILLLPETKGKPMEIQ